MGNAVALLQSQEKILASGIHVKVVRKIMRNFKNNFMKHPLVKSRLIAVLFGRVYHITDIEYAAVLCLNRDIYRNIIIVLRMKMQHH